MNTERNQEDRLLSLVCHGLQEHAKRMTSAMLGDRSQYIGMSDIGRMLECPRSVFMSKVFSGDTPSITQDTVRTVLKRRLVLQRGHWLEMGMENAFKAIAVPFLAQLEIDIVREGIPVRAHLDFTMAGENPYRVRVLELKSTRNLPDALSVAYETQIYGQISLLREYWNLPVFNLVMENGEVLHQRTFPALCRERLGISLPDSPDSVDIQGWVLCMSMDDARPFGPYFPDSGMLNNSMKTAEDLWMALREYRTNPFPPDSLRTADGFNPFCGYCDWNVDCPKFKGLEHPEWEPDLEQLAALKRHRKELETEIGTVESGLKLACTLADADGQWITAGTYRFRVSRQKGRHTLDKGKLYQELASSLGLEKTEVILNQCEKEGESFERLFTQQLSHN